jgi:hypothetical protein
VAGAAAFVQQWIQTLQGSALPGARGLSRRLKGEVSLNDEMAKISNYEKACANRAAANPAAFASEIIQAASQRRAELTQDAHLNNGNRGFPQIVEAKELIPMTSSPVEPGHFKRQIDCSLGETAPEID